MICILKMVGGEITGWIIAQDTHDARRRAQSAGDVQLASDLYRIEFPAPGKTKLPCGHWMLVE